MVHGTDSPLPADYAPPPPQNAGYNTYSREDEPDNPHIWRRSLDRLLSFRSRNQGLGRAMYRLAKWTQQTWQSPAEQFTWRSAYGPSKKMPA